MRDFQNAYPNDRYTKFDKKYVCWANNHNGWRKIGKKRIRREVKEEIDNWEDDVEETC